MMRKKKSITKNYLYNLFYQVLVIILPIIITPYIARVLGAENIGIYSYTISITTFFILFGSLGVALYAQREVAYNQNNREKNSYTFWEIFILKSIAMVVSLVVFYFSFVFRENEYNIYYKILTIEIIANIFDISWFFQGLEEFKKTVLRNIGIKIISIISILTLVKTSEDLTIYLYIYVLSTFFGNISLWLYLPQYLKRVKLSKLQVSKHLKPTIALFIPQIAVQVYTILDKTMIGMIISDKSEVGYYEQSQKIVKILMTIITSLGTVMLPRIANTFANGKKEKIMLYMENSFKFVFLLSFPLIFGLVVVSDNFVPVFFGNGYEQVAILIKVISPIILLIGLSSLIGTQYLLPTKKQKQYTISVVSGAIINIIMNTILIWKFKALGASIATLIAEFTVTFLEIYITRKELNWRKIFFSAKNYFISSIIMFIVCFSCNKITQNNLINITSQVIIGVIVYFLVLVVLKDSFLKQLIEKLKIKRSDYYEK